MYDNNLKLYALVKLISYIKFECEEFESKQFAGSPIVGEILSDVVIQWAHSRNKEPSFEFELDGPFGRRMLSSIKTRLSQTDEWANMSDDDKLVYIKDFASPYVLNQDTILLLKNERDSSV